MDIVTYALAKKVAAGAVSGISKLEVRDQDLIITTNDGTSLTMHFPSPTELALLDCIIDENNHLIMTFIDGNVIDCGELPIIKGDNGITPHIDPTTKHWFIGTEDTGVLAEAIYQVDNTFDLNSENPLQNKVITAELEKYATKEYVIKQITWNSLE